jgi:hypothetical protein
MDFLKETFRDHTRDDYCAGLWSLDIPARLAPRGRPEESVRSHRYGESLGLIQIRSNFIPWVNIWADRDEPGSHYWADYGVPDPRLVDVAFADLRVQCSWVRSIPVVGPIKGTAWRSPEDGSIQRLLSRIGAIDNWKEPKQGRRIAEILNRQDHIKQHVAARGEQPLEIQAHSGCWIMSAYIRHSNNMFSWISPPRFLPTRETWQLYEDVAACLLQIDLSPAKVLQD